MLRTSVTIMFVIAGALAVHAETTIVVNPKDRPMTTGAEQVRVSVGINMFVPVTDGGDRRSRRKKTHAGSSMISPRASALFCATRWRANVTSNRSTSMCSAISSGSKGTA
jgi:hypothetical protein